MNGVQGDWGRRVYTTESHRVRRLPGLYRLQRETTSTPPLVGNEETNINPSNLVRVLSTFSPLLGVSKCLVPALCDLVQWSQLCFVSLIIYHIENGPER